MNHRNGTGSEGNVLWIDSYTAMKRLPKENTERFVLMFMLVGHFRLLNLQNRSSKELAQNASQELIIRCTTEGARRMSYGACTRPFFWADAVS